MITTMKSLLIDAKKNGYAVPAPNVWNEDSIRAAIRTAELERSPLILPLYPVMADILEFGYIARELARKTHIPVAIHLDHGQSFEEAVKAIRAGFTSIMVDRSQLPYKENVAQVKEIVKMAHAVGVTVEAELGHVGQGYEYEKTRDAGLTKPEEAVEFVKETDVDCLAVAIGTSHGVYKGVPKIDFALLDKLNQVIQVPLVLHGGSGTGDDNIARVVKGGISKVNIYTELDSAGREALQENINIIQSKNLLELSKMVYDGYAKKLAHYMHLIGAAERV